jgi:hypothetical protein
MIVFVAPLKKTTRMTMIELPPITFPAPGPHWTRHALFAMVEVVKSVPKQNFTVYFKSQVLQIIMAILFIWVFRVGTAAPAKPVFVN